MAQRSSHLQELLHPGQAESEGRELLIVDLRRSQPTTILEEASPLSIIVEHDRLLYKMLMECQEGLRVHRHARLLEYNYDRRSSFHALQKVLAGNYPHQGLILNYWQPSYVVLIHEICSLLDCRVGSYGYQRCRRHDLTDLYPIRIDTSSQNLLEDLSGGYNALALLEQAFSADDDASLSTVHHRLYCIKDCGVRSNCV